jgi:hypothetical protein
MRTVKTFAAVAIIVLIWLTPLYAQYEFGEGSKLNTNLGANWVMPVNPSAQFVNVGFGFVAGAGYNMSKRNSVIGEFMWNRIYPTGGSLDPINSALGTNINAHTQLLVLSGNYRYELRGKTLGVYLIGGGGWYYRYSDLSREVTVGAVTICRPSWLWWGFTCASGTVTEGQTLRSSNSSAFGGNGGVGFTVRVGEPPYRLYFESRYHYAPNKGVSTNLVVTTFGVRF